MSKGWLQIRGDPAVRRFLFQQTREASLFDQRIDRLMAIVEEFLLMRGVFHAKLHFSSNQAGSTTIPIAIASSSVRSCSRRDSWSSFR